MLKGIVVLALIVGIAVEGVKAIAAAVTVAELATATLPVATTLVNR